MDDGTKREIEKVAVRTLSRVLVPWIALTISGVFPFPKNREVIEKLIDLVCHDGDVILDFFAGSATTGHATITLNQRTGKQIACVLTQLPDRCDSESKAFAAGYATIAEIGKTRLRNAILEIEKDIGCKQERMKSELAGMSEPISVPDLGFRVFKLDRSNFRLWDGSQSGEVAEKLAKQLELHEQHIDPNATQEDILYELLLKAGFPLTTKVEKAEMDGKEVFSIAEGALLVCLQDEITKELIKAMADTDPLQVICLDSGFKNNDQLKANAVQTFKSRNKSAETATVFGTV